MTSSPDSNSRFMPGLYPREFPRFAWPGQDALHVLKTLGDGEVLAVGREYLRRRRWRYAPGSAPLAFVEIDRDRPANPEIGASGLRRKELAPAFLLVIPVLRPAPCHFLFRLLVQPEHLDSEVGGEREGSDAAFRVVGFHAWIMSCASRPIRLVARQAPGRPTRQLQLPFPGFGSPAPGFVCRVAPERPVLPVGSGPPYMKGFSNSDIVSQFNGRGSCWVFSPAEESAVIPRKFFEKFLI